MHAALLHASATAAASVLRAKFQTGLFRPSTTTTTTDWRRSIFGSPTTVTSAERYLHAITVLIAFAYPDGRTLRGPSERTKPSSSTLARNAARNIAVDFHAVRFSGETLREIGNDGRCASETTGGRPGTFLSIHSKRTRENSTELSVGSRGRGVVVALFRLPGPPETRPSIPRPTTQASLTPKRGQPKRWWRRGYKSPFSVCRQRFLGHTHAAPCIIYAI